MLLSSTIISLHQRLCSFHDCPFNRSVVPFCSSSFRLIKPCISFLPECCPNFFFLVTLLYRSAFNFVLLRCIILSNSLTSQGSLVSLVCRNKQLRLLLLFLFCFPSGAILDLGTSSFRSGGVCDAPRPMC